MKFIAPSKKRYDLGRNTYWLIIAIIFIFTTFILVIVATAGSTSNYKPITNVYLGDADIAHINVSKVIPQMKPILTILGSALTAPNQSLRNIFGALKTISTTPALSPLLLLLSNANDTSVTIDSLIKLAPLALEGDPIESTKELLGMSSLIDISNDGNQTLQSISELVSPILQNSNDTQLLQASDSTLKLLSDSDDPLNTVKQLEILNDLTLSEKASLLPVFSLYQTTNNMTQLNDALLKIIQSNISVSSQQISTYFSTLSTLLQSDSSANLTRIFDSLASSSSSSSSQEVLLRSIQSLLTSSTNVNSTLTILTDMIKQNITNNEKAKLALPALISIIDNSNNATTALNIIKSLSLVQNTTATYAQLLALESLLEVSNNETRSISIVGLLQNGLTPNSSTVKYIPSLFTLMNSSANPESTFKSLVLLTSWAQENPDTFTPIVSILNDAQSVEPISEWALRGMTPVLLNYLKIPIYYRLSIFTLCKANIDKDILTCNKPHAVQDLDFRNIIYDSLMESDFEPYLKGLNISADDLHLDGDLLNRQHQYVPSISALLTMNLLTIISSATAIGLMIYNLITHAKYMWCWYTLLCFTFLTALFNGIGATINAIVIEAIKSGTHHDNYGVIYQTGVAYSGLIWTAFVLSCVTTLIVLIYCWNLRRYSKGKITSQKKNADTYSEDSENDDQGLDESGKIMLLEKKSTENMSVINEKQGHDRDKVEVLRKKASVLNSSSSVSSTSSNFSKTNLLTTTTVKTDEGYIGNNSSDIFEMPHTPSVSPSVDEKLDTTLPVTPLAHADSKF